MDDYKLSYAAEEIDERLGKVADFDTTLTQSGKAADAKAVGDAIQQFSEEIAESKTTVSDILEYAPAQSKNLNVTKYVPKTISGVTIEVNDDGSLSLSGTATATIYALTGDENRATRFILYPGTYHLSGGLSAAVKCYLTTYADAITPTTIRSYSDSGSGLTFVIEAECYGFIQVNIANGTNVDGLTMKIQMEKGTAATEYISPWAAGERSARLDDYERRLEEVETEVSGFPVPEYYFENDYLPGRVAAVKAKMQEYMGHGDAFIFLTDAHWHQNAQKSPALLNYISKHLNINKFIGGGDTGGEGGNTDFINTIRRAFPGRIYHTMGNHEYFYPATGSLLAYNMNMYNDDVHTGDPNRNYYYFDNNRAHIRYIVLDSYAPGLTSGGEAQPGYEAEQRTWLENVALDVPDGWEIVVFSHHVYYMNLTTLALTNPTTNGKAMLDILDAYNANTSSKGKVACVIQGHTHYDRITHTTGGIPVIITACDKYQPWIDGGTNKEPWLATRVAGTITEQAFDIVVLDKQAREVHFFRIGGDAFNGVDNDPGTPVNLRTVTY